MALEATFQLLLRIISAYREKGKSGFKSHSQKVDTFMQFMNTDNHPKVSRRKHTWKAPPVYTESEHRDLIVGAVNAERRRLIGIVLAAYGQAKLAGADSLAHALDGLATEMENS